MSIREVASATTRNPQCTSCHAQMNPLGFALGKFGQLGQFQTVEQVYDSTGKLTAQFTPDTAVSNLNIVTPADSANGEADLVELVKSSRKARACFPQQVFRYANMRLETPALDGCS